MFKTLLDRMSGNAKGVKLLLAAAYIDMGDKAAARKVLAEVIAEGTPEEKMRADVLLIRIA